MKHKLIVIIGNVATGKSTLTDLLAEKLLAVKVPADELYKENPFFPLAVGDRTRWSLTSDLWFLKERVKLARETLDLVERSNVVVDSGIYMSWVYAHSRLASGYYTQDEWELYQEYFDELVGGLKLADVVVYLTAPVKQLRERIEKRGREFEIKGHSLEYLDSIEKSLEKLVEQVKKRRVGVMEFGVVKAGADQLVGEVIGGVQNG